MQAKDKYVWLYSRANVLNTFDKKIVAGFLKCHKVNTSTLLNKCVRAKTFPGPVFSLSSPTPKKPPNVVFESEEAVEAVTPEASTIQPVVPTKERTVTSGPEALKDLFRNDNKGLAKDCEL
jgi:hypothetical protein